MNGSLAQLVEQLTLNQLVDSSSLSGPTIQSSQWSLSSAGRASPLQGGGHRFDPYSDHHKNYFGYSGYTEGMLPIGRLAQLGEHLPYKEEVIGSIPIATTNSHLLNGSLAQLVEQLTLNQLVDSSSLSGPTIQSSFISHYILINSSSNFLIFLFYFFFGCAFVVVVLQFLFKRLLFNFIPYLVEVGLIHSGDVKVKL